MRTPFILVTLFLISVVNKIEAKGHRLRGGLKFPRTRMGMGMGMGMGMPVFIPVVIPMGGYGRHRNSYRYGLQCLSCEGIDNELCITSPLTIARRITCPYNQYCSVLRRELSYQAVSTATSEKQENEATNDGASSRKSALKPNETKTITRVMISRGCKSPDVLQNVMAASLNGGSSGGSSTKTYVQFCLTDFCNFGNGKLKCYDCEGTGSNHPCMVRPADVAETVTCQPNEYCNILRVTTLNETSPVDANGTVSISRGCKSAAVTDDEYDADDGTSVLSLSCSSDLCNFVDATHLTHVNSATMTQVSLYTVFVCFLFTFFQW